MRLDQRVSGAEGPTVHIERSRGTPPFLPSGVEGRLLILTLLFTACSVPQLKEFGEKRCDVDGGHACISGYACMSGLCRIPTGMPCTEGQTKACGTDVGECVHGNQRCVGAVFTECEGAVGPATEICDGLDNDCDGATDEDLTAAPACEKQVGVCLGKAKACVAGSYVPTCGPTEYGTDYQANETRCDNKDNDCNGMTDEGVTGGACPNFGVCIGAQRACTAGAPGACMVAGFEAIEVSCDNLDNNCNGMVDEAIVSSTRCALDAGVCANKFASCRSGNIESTCTVASYGVDYESLETLCDGKDNDCDGATDRLPDAGYLRLSTCELGLGVCMNARRACLAGNGESPCTAASYGPRYEVSELTCDLLDNDCDGRVDVSKEAILLATPNAPSGHLSLATSSLGGSAAVYVDERGAVSRVFFRRFDDGLRALGNEFQLSAQAATDASRPSLVRMGTDYAVIWLETVSGSTRLMLARVADTGTVVWLQQVAGGVTVYKDPRVAAGPSNAIVVWVGSPEFALNGAAFDGAGMPSAPPFKTIVPGPDAGVNILGSDVVRRPSSNDFLVGWVAQNGAAFRIRFQAFNNSLVPQGAVREEFVMSETVTEPRLAISGGSGEVLGAWLASFGSAVTLRWLPNALTSPANLVAAAYTGSAADLSLATSADSAAAFWSKDGFTRLVGISLGGDAGVRDFTPPGVTGLLSRPSVTSLDGGLLQVGYEADRGTGFDLFGQAICRP